MPFWQAHLLDDRTKIDVGVPGGARLHLKVLVDAEENILSSMVYNQKVANIYQDVRIILMSIQGSNAYHHPEIWISKAKCEPKVIHAVSKVVVK
jgi:hypothetical protein